MIRHVTSDTDTAEDAKKQSWATLKDRATTPLLTHDSGLGGSLPGTGHPLSLMGKSPPLPGIDEGIAGIDIPKKHGDPIAAGDSPLGITLGSNFDGQGSPQATGETEVVAQHQTGTASRPDGSDVDSATRKFKELYSQHLNVTMSRTLEQSCNLVEWDSAEFSLFRSSQSVSIRVRVDGRKDGQFQMLDPGPRLAMPEQLLKYRQAAYMAADAIAMKIKLDGAMHRGPIIFEAVKYFDGVEDWSEGSRWLKTWLSTPWTVLGGHQEALSILIENDLRNGRLSARQQSLPTEETVKPMHLAVLLREEKMMDWLLSIISQPQETDEPLKTPTATAEYFGAAARFGDFPIHLAAAYTQDPEFWEHHMDKLGRPTGNFLGETPLHRAAAMGNGSAINAFLRHWPEDVLKVDGMLRSVLWHAACSNNEHIMRKLIKAGAPLEMADSRGFAPIHVAALLGNDASLRVLVQEGANINLPLDDGFNLLPIQLAVTHHQQASLEILLKAKTQLTHDCLPSLSFHLFDMAIANGTMLMAYRIWQEVETPFSSYKRIHLDYDWHPACVVNMDWEEPIVPCWMCIHTRRILEMMEGIWGQREDFVDLVDFQPRESLEEPTFESSRGNRVIEFLFKLKGH